MTCAFKLLLTLLLHPTYLSKQTQNILAMTDKRYACSCDWGDDCKRWLDLLSENSPPKSIGQPPFRFRKDVVTKLEATTNNESDEGKNNVTQQNLEKWIAFRKCILRNINRN